MPSETKTEHVVYAVQVWTGERWSLVTGPYAKNPMSTREAGIRYLKDVAAKAPERRFRLVKQTTVVEWETVS